MGIDVTVTIGGAAGQGIQTVSDLLASACHRAGLYLMAVNDFESRIRGGHSFLQLRISDQPVAAPDDQVHLLVALNQETYAVHAAEMAENGRVLMEMEQDKAAAPEGEQGVNVAFTQLAKEAGGKIMANTVAAGAVLGMLGAPAGLMDEVLAIRFGEKSGDVLENNQKAARLGREAVAAEPFEFRFNWPQRGAQGKLLSGARALALGALAADCRVAAFYPMSPATGIMAELAEFMADFPVVVEQAEGEIAAINMVVGASFAGVRAMTATSGGGFSLMVEGLGLAAVTETPVVLINAQRPGPATGLPTRTAQGDLRFVIHASQDEFPRFVLAPTNLDEGFATVIRGFHLAEKYQVPVIILTDQYFNDSLSIAAADWQAPETIERFLVSDADMADPASYRRFVVTESGVSPRAVACQGKARVMVTGNEHREDGHLSEALADRNAQFDKRRAKLSGMREEMKGPAPYFEESRLLLVTWGSTAGAVREAVDRLRKAGHDAGALVFNDLWPFPSDAVTEALSRCEQFVTVELNGSSQLGGLIREQTGRVPAGAILQYDGRPMRPGRIVEQSKTYLEAENG
ncbi:MAG: 2-oxoacid:acceptor oxidoreductase subunit alpha [Thermodesulfobacteriota bacterium]